MTAKKGKKDRTEELKKLTEKLEQGVQDVFETKNYQDYLRFMGRFRQYSVNNSILIHSQMPDATHVAGFNTWKAMKRHVKAGEKGIQIMSGMPMRKEKKDDSGSPILDKNGKPVLEDSGFMLFRPVYVFDVSQTEGDPLPESPKVETLTGTVQCFDEMFQVISNRDFPVEIRDELEGEANGYFSEEEGKIVIKAGLSEAQTIKTLIHETAHSMLHTKSGKEELEKKGIFFTKKDAEVQAESVAYVVCQHFGIDTSDYSFGYIAGWAEGKQLNELKGSLDLIRRTAGDLIDEIVSGFAA